MTQKEKELLLKDLCVMLPYGVKVQNNSYKTTLVNTIEGFDGNVFIMKETYELLNFNTNISIAKNITGYIHKIKPYLRPMASMTDEEKSTYLSYCECDDGDYTGEILYFNTIESFDYLNQIHVDYRNLIPKGLAIEAPEGMYN